MGGIKLEAYSKDGYSLQIPAEYEKNTEEDEGYTAFDEKDDQKSRSRVIVAHEKFPNTLTDSQKDMLFTTAKSALQGQID